MYTDLIISAKKPGGLVELIKLALPAGISQASFSLMMFTDRLLLTPLGKEAPSASMLAGFTSFILAVFFFGLLNYITPLTGQLIGSKQTERVNALVHQGLLISLVAFPFLVIFGEMFVAIYFEWLGIHKSQYILARKYFTIINVSSLFSLINIVFSGFFTGSGKSYIVMTVNTIGMLLNIPLSYRLINYGVFGNFQGVEGAALGSCLSVAIMTVIFIYIYLRSNLGHSFKTNLKLSWDNFLLKKLLVFGSPSGVEMLLTFAAFSTFVALFHSYGVNEALSVTIVFNWDIVAFMPVWGISIALMSLVGKYMGAQDLDSAMRAIKNAFFASLFTMMLASLTFFSFTEFLISIFLPDSSKSVYDEIVPLASIMLKFVSLYCLANAVNLVLSGALRAAGDTKAVMYIAVSGQWLMLIISFLSIKIWQWSPVSSWFIFVCSLFFETLLYSMRFYQGSWKKIRVV